MALRQVILNEGTGKIDPKSVTRRCAQIIGNDEPRVSSTSKTLHGQSVLGMSLEPLPFTEQKLPDVITAVERAYFREAARQASNACAPKVAKMQDVARILGIPRQTAARKWQMHGLPSALLAGAVTPTTGVTPAPS